MFQEKRLCNRDGLSPLRQDSACMFEYNVGPGKIFGSGDCKLDATRFDCEVQRGMQISCLRNADPRESDTRTG